MIPAQALIARLRPHEPTNTSQPDINIQNEIKTTVEKCKSAGLSENTLEVVHYGLTQLSKNANLMNPEEIQKYIADMKRVKPPHTPLSNASKLRYVNVYEYFLATHNLQWKRPKYKTVEIVPIIPTTESVNKIIASATERNATIFTILAETGLSPEELHRIPRKQIDTDQAIISVTGVKGHASGQYKLKTKTAEMLRAYLAKHPEDYPFPTSKAISQAWRQHRNRTATKLSEPNLKNIQLRNLRNYSGAQKYLKTRDAIITMRHLRHKKLDTTMHYIRSIQLDSDPEYITKCVQLGTDTTKKEITELLDAGFQYVTDADGYKYFRKLK